MRSRSQSVMARSERSHRRSGVIAPGPEAARRHAANNAAVRSERIARDELRVIVMESQPAVRLGLGLLLQTSGLRVLGTAQTPDEAEQLILARRPHVALLDAAPALDS